MHKSYIILINVYFIIKVMIRVIKLKKKKKMLIKYDNEYRQKINSSVSINSF